MPKHLLIKNIQLLATPLPEGGWLELSGAVLATEDDQIRFVGTDAEFEIWQTEAQLQFDKTLNAANCVVIPGLVNTHHHLYQSLTRAVGTSGGLALFDWLKRLYPIWGRLTPEAVYVSAKLALAELVMSGCTTSSDHLYMFPNGSRLDDEIAAAREVGIRFQPTRGSMSLGESRGGLPPDDLVENEADILKDCVRVIETFHDSQPRAMLRVGLAPCSPFSVSAELMRESAELARCYQEVRLHTHLAETKDEINFCLERFGKRPVAYAESLGWTGPDVWFAHVVHADNAEVRRLAETCSGVCHCPSSNMILASGIAPVRNMLDKRVRVGLGVDGSASSDAGHLLAEARQAMLLQRVQARADALSAREALQLATLGGAAVLGRDDIGSLVVGRAADVVAYRLDDLAHAGALSAPLGALLTCQPQNVKHSVINGEVVVEDGAFLPFELGPLIEIHNRLSRAIIES